LKRRMHTIFCLGIILAVLGGGLFGCAKEGPGEKAGKKIDKAVDQAGEQIDKAAEKVRDIVK